MGLSLTVLVALVGLQSANRESETERRPVLVVWVYLRAAFFLFSFFFSSDKTAVL